jgi:hypothetical protein
VKYGETMRVRRKKDIQNVWEDHMKKIIMIIVLIILFSLFTGCIYVNPLVQAGEQKGTPDQATAIQLCQISCENHIKYLPLGCICPEETPTHVPLNSTPSPAGK